MSAGSQKLLVNGVDLSAFVEQSTWSISQEWSRHGDQGMFHLSDEHPTGPLSFVVKPMSTIVFSDPLLGVTLFSGITSIPEYTWEGPINSHWSVPCRDWTCLSDLTVVAGDYFGMTADAVIKALVAQQPCGLTTNNVMPGPHLNRAKIKQQSLTSALKQVEQLSSQYGVNYGSYIDETRDIHFYNQNQAVSSGLTLTDAAVPTTPTLVHHDRNFKYVWDGTAIRNDIFLRGASITTSQVDNFRGDGTTKVFSMTYVPDINGFPTGFGVTVNGVAKTVAIDNGSAPTTQWLISKAPMMYGIGRWVLQLGTTTVPIAGDVVALTYNYLQPVVTRVQDLASVASFNSLPNGGHFQMYLADPTLVNVLAAKNRGLRELSEYSISQERIELEITEEWTGHVRAGTTFQFVSQVIPDSKNNWNLGMTGTFLILSNRISGKPGLNRRYAITGVRIA